MTLTIITGGQSGVDRGALRAAVDLGLDYGGWAPAGGCAEDRHVPPGILADFPRLREIGRADPAVRTVANVAAADALLLVLPRATRCPGTELAAGYARWLGRTILLPGDPLPEGARSVNVAGPRASAWPGAHAAGFAAVAGLAP